MYRLHYLNEVESHARTYAVNFPRLFVSGSGIRVRDSQGNELIDCLMNAGALPLGHNHPEVKKNVMEFLAADHVQQALDLATPAKYEFVHELFGLLPPGLRERARIQFCSPSGSDAVEAALKLARFHTGRATIVAFHGAYHGMTAGALGAMGNLLPKSGLGLVTAGIHFAPYPYTYRCPFGSDGSQTERLSLNYLQTLLSDPESGVPKPAAVILEVVQGEGGCIPVSDEWLRGVRDITRQQDVLLIVDEVQTGFGRTGVTFAFESSGITPDILVLSKAIGGGYPLAVIVYDRSLDSWPIGMHAGTFRGNQIAMIAGCKTMQILARDRLAEKATARGSVLLDGLDRIARRFPCLGHVRGRGLMIGVEVIDPEKVDEGPSRGALARKIRDRCLQHGLIVETGGRHGAVVRFLPPLIITNDDIAAILERFEAAVGEAVRSQFE